MVRLERFIAIHLVAGLVRSFDLQVRRATLEIKAVCRCGERPAYCLAGEGWFGDLEILYKEINLSQVRAYNFCKGHSVVCRLHFDDEWCAQRWVYVNEVNMNELCGHFSRGSKTNLWPG